MQFKYGTWWLKKGEDAVLRQWLAPKIPAWIQTWHLTLMTIPEAVLCLLGGYLAQNNINWLWLTTIGVIGHYFTDILDGEIGRQRETGLIKWGFYMDHVLDLLLLFSVLIGYSFITHPDYKWYLFFVSATFTTYMFHSILHYSATGKFEIAMFGFGPSEIRWVFVIINTMLIYFGKVFLSWTLPWVLLTTFLAILIAIYNKQRTLWELDMSKKGKSQTNPSRRPGN